MRHDLPKPSTQSRLRNGIVLMPLLMMITLCLSRGVVLAEPLRLSISPLLSVQEQIKQIKQECTRAGMPEHCKQQLENLAEQQSKLRDHCNKKPNDYRCDALHRKKLGSVNPLEELCSRDPYHTKCVRRRDRAIARKKRMLKYCKERPESSRCTAKPVKKKVPYIVTYCKKYPDSRSCKQRLEDERRRKDPYYKSGKNNTF